MESKEDKISRLRTEREDKNIKKKQSKFFINENGTLSKYDWKGNNLFVGMPVKVQKPDRTWRSGIIEYINIEDENMPKIGVICGKNNVKFEKKLNEIQLDTTLQKILDWEIIEIPEEFKKMTTSKLLINFRAMRRLCDWQDKDENIYQAYKKELFLREHVGQKNKKGYGKHK